MAACGVGRRTSPAGSFREPIARQSRRTQTRITPAPSAPAPGRALNIGGIQPYVFNRIRSPGPTRDFHAPGRRRARTPGLRDLDSARTSGGPQAKGTAHRVHSGGALGSGVHERRRRISAPDCRCEAEDHGAASGRSTIRAGNARGRISRAHCRTSYDEAVCQRRRA